MGSDSREPPLVARLPRISVARLVPPAVAVGLALVLLSLTTVAQGHLGSNAALLAPPFLVAALLLGTSSRLEVTLAAIALYLGLLDGYAKLSTGGNVAAAGRDVLLYAIVAGALIRLAIRNEPVRLPPLSGHVLFFVAIVVLAGLNPATPGIKGWLGGMKQDVEFVPLFFLSYAAMRSQSRIRGLLILLIVITVANAIVALVQFNLTPQELASWGPGYAERVLGTGAFAGAGRTFAAGLSVHVRPFGLGSDLGDAGQIAWLGGTAALALVLAHGSGRLKIVAVLGLAASVLAIVTAQSRGVVLVSIFALLCYALLATTSRQLARSVGTLLVGGLVIFLVISVFTSRSGGDPLRLDSLAPSRVGQTVISQRGNFLASLPSLALHYPFGVGLGRVGPASGFSNAKSTINAENEFTFLINEVGTVGLVIFLSLWLRVIVRGVRIVKLVSDPAARAYAAALVSGLLALALAWFYSSPSAAVPTAPYFWAVAGVFAYGGVRTVGGLPLFANDDRQSEPPRAGSVALAAGALHPDQAVPGRTGLSCRATGDGETRLPVAGQSGATASVPMSATRANRYESLARSGPIAEGHSARAAESYTAASMPRSVARDNLYESLARSGPIAVVSTFAPAPDGIARYADQYVASLTDRGLDVMRVGLSGRGGGGDITIDVTHGARFLRVMRAVPQERTILIMWHGHYMTPGRQLARVLSLICLTLSFVGRRTIVLQHELDDELVTGARGLRRIARVWEERLRWVMWLAASEIWFHSQHERAAFQTRYRDVGRRTKLQVTHHGEGFVPAVAVTRGDARLQLSLPVEECIFVCAGFLSPHKGVDRVIAAFELARPANARLVIVGDAMKDHPETRRHIEHLQSLAARVQRVEIREGYLSDVEFDLWLTAADFVVTAYRSAASSSVIPRAQLLGARVIGSGVGGTHEQLRLGVDFVATTDAELVRVMQESAAQMGRNRPLA